MTIMDARVMPIANERSLDSFVFMELDKRIEIGCGATGQDPAGADSHPDVA